MQNLLYLYLYILIYSDTYLSLDYNYTRLQFLPSRNQNVLNSSSFLISIFFGPYHIAEQLFANLASTDDWLKIYFETYINLNVLLVHSGTSGPLMSNEVSFLMECYDTNGLYLTYIYSIWWFSNLVKKSSPVRDLLINCNYFIFITLYLLAIFSPFFFLVYFSWFLVLYGLDDVPV